MSDDISILTTGRLYVDLIFSELDADPLPGREVFASDFRIVAGGGAFITAAYCANLGLKTGIWGVRPAAPMGELFQQDVANAGLIDHTVAPPSGTAPQLTAVVTGRGRDRMLVTHKPGCAIPDGPLPNARHLHISELSTALEEPDLIPRARDHGMTISLDCGWSKGAFNNPDSAEIIRSVDIFMPNQSELDELKLQRVDISPKQGLVIKRGAHGASAIFDAKQADVAATATDAQDSTGAGDAFNAGFLAAWLQGDDLKSCLQMGNFCGARAVSMIGGWSPD